MVFLTVSKLMPRRNVDAYWRKAMWLRMSWAFHGRKRNCYSLALRCARRSLRYSYFSRSKDIKKRYIRELFDIRINAACREHGMMGGVFRRGLLEADVLLNRKVLSDLAIYEPRSFKSLVDFIHQRNSHLARTGRGLTPPAAGSYTIKDMRI